MRSTSRSAPPPSSPTELATRVFGELAGEAHVAPLILLTGSARDPESGAVASGVTVSGVDRRFFDLFARGGAASIDEEESSGEDVGESLLGRPSPGVIVNQALATELEVAAGDSILVAVERPGDAPRETLYGSSETSDVVRELRVEVTRVVPDRGLGRFSLATDQSLPFLAFLDLAAVQKALGQEGRANTLVVDLAEDGETADGGRGDGRRAERRRPSPPRCGARSPPRISGSRSRMATGGWRSRAATS